MATEAVAAAAPGGGSDRPVTVSNSSSSSLASWAPAVDALLKVPVIQDAEGRRTLQRWVERGLKKHGVFEEHRNVRLYVLHVVEVCSRYPAGLTILADALTLLDPDSTEMRQALRLLPKVIVRGLLPELERDSLRAMLTGLEAPGVVDAYLAAAGASAHAVHVRSVDAWQAFEELEEMNTHPGGLAPCLVFVELLTESVDRRQAEMFRAWVDRQAMLLGLEGELQRLRSQSPSHAANRLPVAHLIIQVLPLGRERDRYQISHWRQVDPRGWYPERGEDTEAGEAGLERAVEALIRALEIDLAWFDGPIYLELILPRELLHVRVEEWVIESDTDVPTPLGLKYPLVLRSLERMRRADWHRELRGRWNHIGDEAVGEATYWCRPGGESISQLEQALTSERRLVSMVLSGSPVQPDAPSRVDELVVGLRTGLPVLIWDRESCEHQMFKEGVRRLMQGDLTELPERVKSVRASATDPRGHDHGHLVVLLDNPEHLVGLDSPGIAG